MLLLYTFYIVVTLSYYFVGQGWRAPEQARLGI